MISNLVNDFQTNEQFYLSSAYSEAQARLDFIDKFFIALSWDVNHDTQKNPYEQEVIVEKSADSTKRADYMFTLAPKFREPKFFVEAKKPSRQLKNIDDYFQTMRYGWNAQNPFALLFDFEELHILDSRYKPDPKSVLDKCYKRFHYSEYLDKEKFSEIYYLFSRESVANNSIEKSASELPKPKGKAVQKGLFAFSTQSIDESFLDLLDEIRLRLAKSLKKNNVYLDGELLTETTQRIIDRLVFIRFLEDKDIESERHISGYGEKGNAWKDFVNDSKWFNAKYNGIVFREHNIIDGSAFKGPDEKDFADICEELSHYNSPYDFRYIPINILGSIYERFLGKVIHSTEKRVTIEEKPEVRKAGGVYYTPQYIVDYIVDNTVGKLILNKTPIEISKMRFADISCGSGSFLITVFDELLQYISIYYQERPKEAKKAGCLEKDGKWILSLKQKKEILLNNVYGVDIDSQAVEVTQLSLFLKLLEDETLATAHEFDVMFKERILPDLGKNIVCGNSLIGTDIYSNNLFESSDEEKKINAMDFENAFPEIMKNGGFDAIVGNPPYGANTITNEDTYISFIKRSIDLLIKKGLISYIVPTSWLSGVRFIKIRKLILENFEIHKIINLPFNIFKDCYVDTSIFLFEKSKVKDNQINVYSYPKKEKLSDLSAADKNFSRISKGSINQDENLSISTNPLLYFLKQKYQTNQFISLGEISSSTIGVLASKYNISESKKKNFYDYFVGNINRYTFDYLSTNYIDLSNHKEEYLSYFFNSKKIWIRRIINRQDRIMCTIPPQNFVVKKDIYSFSLMNTNLREEYVLAILNSKLISFLYLNSSAISTKDDFRQTTLTELRNLPIYRLDLNSKSDAERSDKLVNLSNQLIESKKKLINSMKDHDRTYWESRCNSIDRDIDKLVYDLYGLAEEEIKIVEGTNE